MKIEWKKSEKQYYLPKAKPEKIYIPKFGFYTIEGEGDPNAPEFENYISVLYSLSYGIRMSPKSNNAPDNYAEYTVYPLEGVWDINESAKVRNGMNISKSDYAFKLMIRQPDFVDENYALAMIEFTKKKKPHNLLSEVRFETIEEGDCIQMLHLGAYDDEPKSFEIMEKYAAEINVHRTCKTHREIYLSDPRRTAADKLKTVLRFKVEL